MLLQKKHKHPEDKLRNNPDPPKKPKKIKNASPIKLKVTPEKLHRKDENAPAHHNHCYSQTQPLDFHKLKQKQIFRPSQSKKAALHETRSKLLTTSPVLFDHSASHSRKKSKVKSKQKSTVKGTAAKSTHKEKDLIKNVSKRLYTEIKEDKNKSNSKSKSKSRSKSKSMTKTKGKSISPLKEIKRPKDFNVAEREVSFKKSQVQDQRKSIKKKIRTKMKGEELQKYPQTDRPNYPPQKEEPKMKLKKKVPQIKTEFSERRGSYIDEVLLKKLELGQSQLKKTQNNPFLHLKSNFEMKLQKGNAEITSRSQMKTYEEPNWQSQSRAKQLQNFKREQEARWNKLLAELQNLKTEEKVPQKIDELIKQLNDNYSSLQEKVSFLEKSQSERSREEEVLKKQQESSMIVKQGNNEQQNEAQNGGESKGSFNIVENQKSAEGSHQLVLGQNQEEKLGPIYKTSPQQILQSQGLKEIQPKEIDQKNEVHEESKDPVQTDIYLEKNQQIEQLKPSTSDEVQIEGNKLNAIHLDNEFYDFFESNKKKLKLQILSNSPSQNRPSNQKILASSDAIEDPESHKQSDKNLLQQLDFLQGPSKLVEVISVSKSTKTEFEEQMQSIRQIQSEQFGNMVCLDFVPGFDHQMKMPQQMSSQSILLKSFDCLHQNDSKIIKIVDEVQHSLILQFCTTIIRSKQILHNFMNTYSQLVQANVINNDLFVDVCRPALQCSNEHVMKVMNRLLEYLQSDMKELLMRQIKMPFECKPICILKFMRFSEDSPFTSMTQTESEEEKLLIPFFNQEQIQKFQTNVLKNQYYIPTYFSFNQSIYDLFNDTFDVLRPFGSKGKAIFSLDLSHPITSFRKFKSKLLLKVQKELSEPFYEEDISNFSIDYQEQGVFQLIYFTCLDIIEQIFQRQTLLLYQFMLNKQHKQFNLF